MTVFSSLLVIMIYFIPHVLAAHLFSYPKVQGVVKLKVSCSLLAFSLSWYTLLSGLLELLRVVERSLESYNDWGI